MAEKVKRLALERDYRKFLYFIDGYGNVCRKAKSGGRDEILVKDAVKRDADWLYFIDKDGDLARTARPSRFIKKAEEKEPA